LTCIWKTRHLISKRAWVNRSREERVKFQYKWIHRLKVLAKDNLCFQVKFHRTDSCISILIFSSKMHQSRKWRLILLTINFIRTLWPQSFLIHR
jgi:hypothetical protein